MPDCQECLEKWGRVMVSLCLLCSVKPAERDTRVRETLSLFGVPQEEEDRTLPASEIKQAIQRDVVFYGHETTTFETQGGNLVLKAGPVEWCWVHSTDPGVARRKSTRARTAQKPICVWVSREHFIEAVNGALQSKVREA